MTLNQRQKDILQFLSEVRHAKVDVLAKSFSVSQETIRRDLLGLEKNHSIKRVRGGAVYYNYRAREIEYQKKLENNYATKDAIARLAVDYINDGDAIMIGNGSTTTVFAAILAKTKQNLTVITNSSDIADALNVEESNKVYLLGGLLRKHNRSIVGSLCTDFADNFKVDKTIVSVDGVSITNGVTEYNVEEAATIRKMLEIAQTRMILCEFGKFSEVALTRVCDARDVNYVFTDWHLSAKDVKQWEGIGVTVVTVKKGR
ncbi:MAG: DeoR/GlpR transcriptional regulator [Lachnospiraceae bacterium]|nr:DeoR/GlpR transcriptional regulator [Lachnospiraceae bacterium]